MSWSWLYLASRTTTEHFCGKPGHPYCPEHKTVMEDLMRLDEDFEKAKETHRAACAEATADGG
jgi:hypothetical protein